MDTVNFNISLTVDPGQINAILDWARPSLTAHLDMYNLTADFYQGSEFPIGVTNLTRVVTGPCRKNITYIYCVIVTGGVYLH